MLFAIVALSLFSGCVFSKQAVFTSSDDVVVPDFSGTYAPLEKSGEMVVVRKAKNVFEVLLDKNTEPEQVVVVPLDVAGMYLLQYSKEDDYAFLALRMSGDRVDVLTFAALIEESGEANDRLEALFGKHDLKIDNSMLLLEQPSADAMIAFFSECADDPRMLTEIESWIKR